MNRRELLKRGFELGAAGLLLPMVEPIRRYWSLDRTMIPQKRDLDFYKNHPAEYFQDFGSQVGWSLDSNFATHWKTSGYYVRAVVGDHEVLLPMEEVSKNNWQFLPPEPMTIVGLQYTRSPIYAASS